MANSFDENRNDQGWLVRHTDLFARRRLTDLRMSSSMSLLQPLYNRIDHPVYLQYFDRPG